MSFTKTTSPNILTCVFPGQSSSVKLKFRTEPKKCPCSLSRPLSGLNILYATEKSSTSHHVFPAFVRKSIFFCFVRSDIHQTAASDDRWLNHKLLKTYSRK